MNMCKCEIMNLCVSVWIYVNMESLLEKLHTHDGFTSFQQNHSYQK